MSVSRLSRRVGAAMLAGVALAQLAPPKATDDGRVMAATGLSSVYVGPGGFDAPGAGAPGSPFRTIQYAVQHVGPGGSVHVAPGSYAPFTVSTSNVTVSGQSRTGVVVHGRAGVRAVVTLAAAGDRVTNLSVTGCVPNPVLAGDFESAGSASVLVTETAPDSVVSKLTISHGGGINSYRLPFGCFGVYVAHGSRVTVSRNDILGQGEGVFLYRGGDRVSIDLQHAACEQPHDP